MSEEDRSSAARLASHVGSLMPENADQRARAFEYLFDAVVVTDMQGTITDWNPGAVKLYGYERDEVIGQPVSILHARDEVDRLAEIFASIERRGYWTGEIRRRHRDGSIGWIESFVIPVLDAAGSPSGALGINRDITARVEAEHQLRDTEHRWRALLEGSPDAIVIVDKDGTVQLINARAEGLFGWSRAELVGKPLEQLVPEARRAAHVAHRARFTESVQARPMDETRHLRGRRRDGTEFPVDVRLSAIDTPSGRMVISIVRDLTEREHMLDQLRVLGAALGATVNGVAISDPRGRCEWINPGFTAITGYTEADIVGQLLSVLKSGVHGDAFYRELWETISAGRHWHGEITNRRKDGKLYVEEQSITPVRNLDGEIAHFVAIKQDVTARRAMEDELRFANERLRNQLTEIQALQAQLREQAIRDPLTGLHNRRFLSESLDREIARAEREARPIAFALMDIDHFKHVNDTYGHGAGDGVLMALAALLRDTTRRSDIVCRYGGEEFIVLMPGMAAEAAVKRADEWRERFAATIVRIDEIEIRATLSVGLAHFPAHGRDGPEVLRAADEALYDAKSKGRNKVRVAPTRASDVSRER